ncbi:arabinofuranosidase [Coniella lustricola]|uniref:Arabinofuranosidase n=1 Tax=Coniella lustricola TaxID=2025994 RepID=A0A2T2ZZ78_9PEZI|nr:arabinofuranosidase [Coniella lustricola]
MLPGFHPDPSCIFVREWNDTFFCASSSFNAFPGIPVHASKDLQNWKLIGNVLNREEQLPTLADTNSSTSGIWAPTIRYSNGTFWLVTTLVFDDTRPDNDSTRWDNILFNSTNPYDPASWSIATHFPFFGYDTSPFWDTDGQAYIVGSHFYRVYPGLELAPIDLSTGELLEDWQIIWNGAAGAEAPEGPHLYYHPDESNATATTTHDDGGGCYYLLVAEGGTGYGHRVDMARSRALLGPYDGDPADPELTAANTTNYFQTVGHADVFQDASDNWWGVALSTRGGPASDTHPMGRETVLTAVSWDIANNNSTQGSFPIWTPITGEESVWALPPVDKYIPCGLGPWIDEGDDFNFPPGSDLPPHFTYYRFPNASSFAVSPDAGHANTLRLLPSSSNLTGLDGTSALGGQTFVGRRQQDTLFTYRATLVEYAPTEVGEEAGVTAFLTQDHHLDLGVVVSPSLSSSSSANESSTGDAEPVLQLRYRGISAVAVPAPVVTPLPDAWLGKPLVFEIKAPNETHFAFSVGLACEDGDGDEEELQTIVYVPNNALSYGFTGTFLGIYATSNGGNGTTAAYFSDWRYLPQGQIRDY